MRTNDKFAACVADEKRARDQLTGQWASFDPAARTRCASTSTGGHAASYLELLVCLELEQANKEVHGQGRTPGITIIEPARPAVSGPDEATDAGPIAAPSRPAVAAPSRPAPVAAPSRPAAVAVPSQPAPVPRSPQQPVARSTAAAPSEPAPAAPLALAPPPPTSAPQRPSETELLQQSFCRSPWGYVLPGCR
jgi:hypothetical protein